MRAAVKHDGDLKLASLSPQAAVVLELTRTGRLFEIYENSTAGGEELQQLSAQRSEALLPASGPQPYAAGSAGDLCRESVRRWSRYRSMSCGPKRRWEFVRRSASSWRERLAHLRLGHSAHAKILGGSLIMLVGSIFVSLANFGYNIGVARMLGPADFSHAAAAVTILMLVSAITLGLSVGLHQAGGQERDRSRRKPPSFSSC